MPPSPASVKQNPHHLRDFDVAKLQAKLSCTKYGESSETKQGNQNKKATSFLVQMGKPKLKHRSIQTNSSNQGHVFAPLKNGYLSLVGYG